MNPVSYVMAQLEENHEVVYLLILIMFVFFVLVDVKGRLPSKAVAPDTCANETKPTESNTSSKKKSCVQESMDNCVLMKKAE